MSIYSKEFKEEAKRLSDEIGIKKAAEQLGIILRLSEPKRVQRPSEDLRILLLPTILS